MINTNSDNNVNSIYEVLSESDSNFSVSMAEAIENNIVDFFCCEKKDIKNVHIIPVGLTNISFNFELNGKCYVYRHPGNGTEVIINRANEKENLELAKALDIDPTYVYMDKKTGWKISKCVGDFREPDYESFEDSKKVIEVLRRLHRSKLRPDFEFDPWKESAFIKGKLIESGFWSSDYNTLEAAIEKLVERIKNDGVEKCFCHCDTYRHNWMFTKDRVILIDWEYAGVSDPGVDIGYYISDAMYDFSDAEQFIKEYCGENYNEKLRFHYMAYTAIISYYWFVWALYRESCGADMGDSLDNWKLMAEKYSAELL